MPIERIDDLPPVITYPRDAIVQKSHVAAALDVDERIVDRMDLPSFGAGQRPRFLWGQVLDVLAERAVPTARDQERAAAAKSLPTNRRR